MDSAVPKPIVVPARGPQDPVTSPLHALVNPATSPLLIHSQLEQLGYDIESYSSFSAQFHPRNVKVNKPTDQGSRWSTSSNNQKQFLTLKLDRPSVVHTITFGKYHKVHVCNIKEFKVFGGSKLDNMTELLHSGLRNDNEAETFPLKYKSNGMVFPCTYIKIVPLLAWGTNFNFSVWYVELRGVSDPDLVQQCQRDFLSYQEQEAMRLCLKHLRQRNYMDTFNALQDRAHLKLEHPTLTEMHAKLVIEGDFDALEAIIQRSAESNYFSEYISLAPYKPIWTRIRPVDANGESPSMRGGHQMCMDVEAGLIYLFGGWDGTKDLSDFWCYNVQTEMWHRISADTRRQHGPGPRSCHKICFESRNKQIYVLGRYVDPQSRPTNTCDSDFYRYDTGNNTWHKITDNTFAHGGPELIYDHQMVIDSNNMMLYSFGGRIISSAPNVGPENTYSGLYSFNLVTEQWKLLRSDNTHAEGGGGQMRARIGHSMLINPNTRQLFIFAGQRHKDYLSDYYIYDIDSDTVIEMCRDSAKNHGPDPGFTQRATIDLESNEFFVFSGLMREKNSAAETVKNSFWVYNISRDQWTKIYHNENTGETYWSKMADKEPCPRFAHQLVYDHINKVQYLFGGNPGGGNANVRLDDFWTLRLERPLLDDVVRHCKFLIRRQRFKEMCASGDSMEALKFLQVEISQSVNHSNAEESAAFRQLTSYLFETSPTGGDSEDKFQLRNALYEELVAFFPNSMKQPKENLIDLLH